jgi:hypothetical protein
MIKKMKKHQPLHPAPNHFARMAFYIYVALMVGLIVGHMI